MISHYQSRFSHYQWRFSHYQFLFCHYQWLFSCYQWRFSRYQVRFSHYQFLFSTINGYFPTQRIKPMVLSHLCLRFGTLRSLLLRRRAPETEACRRRSHGFHLRYDWKLPWFNVLSNKSPGIYIYLYIYTYMHRFMGIQQRHVNSHVFFILIHKRRWDII